MPGVSRLEGFLLACLLAEGSSDVGIFLHHESRVGGTQVKDDGVVYVIDRHGGASVRTHLIGAIGSDCRRKAAIRHGGVERVVGLVPAKAGGGGLKGSYTILVGDIEAVHDEGGLAGECGKGSACLLGEGAILDCGGVVGEEVGAASVHHPENLWADRAATQSMIDGSVAVPARVQRVGAARDREIGVHG